MSHLLQFSTTRKEIDIDLIYKNPWNPNVESEFIFEKLKKNIQEYGFNDPVLVTRRHNNSGQNYIIIDGEHRWKAAKELGFRKIIVEEMIDLETKKPMHDFDIQFLTVQMNNTRGEDDTVKRGKILKALQANNPEALKNLSLFPDQIENEIKAIDFQFEYNTARPTLDTDVTMSFKIPANQLEYAKKVLKKINEDPNKAFLKLIKDEGKMMELDIDD